jgi:agmatinase
VLARGLPDTPESDKERAPAPEGVQPVIELDTSDPTYDLWKLVRDDLSEGREPGLINVQRAWGGTA